MLTRYGSSDAEAQTNTCLGGIARRLPPVEWRKNLLLFLGRNAGPIVVNNDGNAAGVANDVDAHASTIFDGIIDQVCDRTADIGRPARNIDAALASIRDLTAGIAGVFADIANEDTEIDQPSRLPASVIARESQCGIDHGIHVFQVIEH